MYTQQYEQSITLNLFVCCSVFSHFFPLWFIFTVHYSVKDTCCGGDFSAQALKELSFSAHIAVVLRAISAWHTYLSRINTSRLRIKLDKQEFISNIQSCQAWKWYIFKHICNYYQTFYWRIFLGCQPAAYHPFLLHDDISHINNLLQAFTSVPAVISKQRLWNTDVSHTSQTTAHWHFV